MFAFRSTVERLESDLLAKDIQLKTLIEKWNALVRRINAKGGESFLSGTASPTQSQFSEKEIKTLISLCHPDKHNGRESAVEITKRLLKIKEEF